MSGENILISGIRVSQNGENNRLYIGNGAKLYNCHIKISGDNNVIYIGIIAPCVEQIFILRTVIMKYI